MTKLFQFIKKLVRREPSTMDAINSAAGLSDFEIGVLNAVHDLQPTGYGLTIHILVEKRFGFVSLGRIYTTFDRLVDLGLISTVNGESRPDRGGRPKLFVSLTEKGAALYGKLLRQLTCAHSWETCFDTAEARDIFRCIKCGATMDRIQ